ncbi:MAG: hypothetical protein AAGF01_03080 [Cyanobacteria bacterium P01_G01_bin.38]
MTRSYSRGEGLQSLLVMAMAFGMAALMLTAVQHIRHQPVRHQPA